MDAEGLERLALADEVWIPNSTAHLLRELGRLDELRQQAELGDWNCARELIGALAQQGEHEAAQAVLAPFAATGWWRALAKHADLLVDRGELDEAAAFLGPYAASGERGAVRTLAQVLGRLGRHHEALDLLRPHARDRLFAGVLAEDLAGHGLDAEIAALLAEVVAETGDPFMVGLLAGLQERRGRPDEAVALLHTPVLVRGDRSVIHVEQLAELLARHGRIAELRELAADPTDGRAAQHLARWYAAEGDADAALAVQAPNAERRRTAESLVLAEILTALGRIDEAAALLRPLALRECEYPYTAGPAYVTLLIEHGRHEEAFTYLDEAEAESRLSSELLMLRIDILRDLGRAEEALSLLRAQPDADGWYGRRMLATELRRLERPDELLALLDPPRNRFELQEAAEALLRLGRIGPAMDLLRSWQNPPGVDTSGRPLRA